MSWFEIHTDDLEACARFYGDVFGWKPERMSDEHWHVQTGASVLGLAFRRRGASAPIGSPVNGFVCVFDTADLDGAWARAIDRRATPGVCKFAVPGGVAAYLNDPFGNIFGLFQRAPGAAT